MPLILIRLRMSYVRLPVVEEHWQESLLMVKLLLERCHICLSSVIRHLAWFLKVSERPHNHIKQLPQHVWMCHPVVLSCLHPACRHSPFFIPLYSLSLPQTFLGSIRADLASEGWERGGLKVYIPCSSSFQHLFQQQPHIFPDLRGIARVPVEICLIAF